MKCCITECRGKQYSHNLCKNHFDEVISYLKRLAVEAAKEMDYTPIVRRKSTGTGLKTFGAASGTTIGLCLGNVGVAGAAGAFALPVLGLAAVLGVAGYGLFAGVHSLFEG